MSAPLRRSVVPFLAGLAVTSLAVVGARRWAPELAEWADEPSLAWSTLALLCYGAAAALVVQSFPLLRATRLYALAFALLPLASVQFLHHSQLLATGDGQRLLGDAQRLLGAMAPTELQDRAPGALERLHAALFLVCPAALLLAGLVPVTASLRTLRWATAGLVGGQVIVLALLLAWGPEHPLQTDHAPLALAIVAGVGAVSAIVVWRSVAGLGGAVAALHLLLLVTGLAHAGVGFTPLLKWLYLEHQLLTLDQVGLGELAPGTDRLLLQLLPLLLVGVVAREWINGLSHRTSHDALTDIYNKAYAEAIVEESGAMDLGGRYCVALADIDHFKKVNDTYGHGAGDVVLAQVAAVIREAVGTRGVVCRTGGEEITIFFPFIPLAEAIEISEQVRKRVGGTTIRCTSNEGRREKLTVTLSIGVASNVDEAGKPVAEKVRQVVEAADRSVYAAKKAGRNQVVSGA